MILHILNGDCALKGWQQCNFTGEVLVWRENYLQGTIPETEDLTAFNHIRAEELHKISREKSGDEIFTELQAMHRKLFSLTSGDKLVLWLDLCPFDQALKKRLLDLIDCMPDPPQLILIQADTIWDGNSFRKYKNLL